MKKVLCIGSVTADVIVSPADSIPPPGTLRWVGSITTHVGGCAANAAIDLAKLGVPAALSCKVGEDAFGDFVIQTAEKHGVDSQFIVREKGLSTTVCVVCVGSDGERSFLYNPGSTSAFKKEDIPVKAPEDSDIVFVAGAMLLTAFDGAPCAALLREAKGKGKITVMDTAWDSENIWLPKIKETLPFLDWFMPSVEEASRCTGETDPIKIADNLFAMGVKNVIIKLGKDGALICPSGCAPTLLPTYQTVKAVDTTGAGDAFCAGFLAGLSQGWDTLRSGRFANAVGTHCVMTVGASDGVISIKETLQFMDTHSI